MYRVMRGDVVRSLASLSAAALETSPSLMYRVMRGDIVHSYINSSQAVLSSVVLGITYCDAAQRTMQC
jgi:hypothetical protein